MFTSFTLLQIQNFLCVNPRKPHHLIGEAGSHWQITSEALSRRSQSTCLRINLYV